MILKGNKATSLNSYRSDNTGKRYDYRIAIPSYYRDERLKNSTLRILSEGNIPKELIDIFVANSQQEQQYRKTLSPETYDKIIVGVPGMMNIRNFIQDYYDDGDRLVCIDDDIQKVFSLQEDGKCERVEDLNLFFNYAFQVSEELQSTLWGIYPVNNAYFMKRQIVSGLRFICGCFWGVINSRDPSLRVMLDNKEDYDRTIRRYLRDGSTVRFDFVGVDTPYYTEPGGMQHDGKRTNELIEASGRWLIKQFPMLAHENTARKKHFEIKLRDDRPGYKEVANLKFHLMD